MTTLLGLSDTPVGHQTAVAGEGWKPRRRLHHRIVSGRAFVPIARSAGWRSQPGTARGCSTPGLTTVVSTTEIGSGFLRRVSSFRHHRVIGETEDHVCVLLPCCLTPGDHLLFPVDGSSGIPSAEPVTRTFISTGNGECGVSLSQRMQSIASCRNPTATPSRSRENLPTTGYS